MYSLPYGTSHIEVPDLWQGQASVLSPGPFPETDPAETVHQALEAPLGGVALEDICYPGARITCVIPDLTRRASVKHYLPVLLRKMTEARVRPSDVTILVALGIHRALTDSEIQELVGSGVVENYAVINHDAGDEEASVLIGTTEAGIPVRVNRLVANADSVILTGGITGHYFAGYGGGRKSLLPGVASRRACEAHHKLVVSWRRGELEGELAAGVLGNNPVHKQMIQACSFAPPIFVLNVVTEPAGRIVAASAGELENSHEDACRNFDGWYRRELPEQSKLVVAGCGGYPRDVNFVQAHKGLYTAHRAVSSDGVVIIAAECGEGTGHADFLGWFERCDAEARWLDELESGYQINGQTAFSTWLRVNSVPTVLVSRMNASDVERMGMVPAENIDEALEVAKRILGELPAPVIIPDGGDILLDVRSV